MTNNAIILNVSTKLANPRERKHGQQARWVSACWISDSDFAASLTFINRR